MPGLGAFRRSHSMLFLRKGGRRDFFREWCQNAQASFVDAVTGDWHLL